MVEFLLNRMSEMGEENQDRSNLYLKLFKTVFDSVSTFSAENEHMLQPYLHQIVNKLVIHQFLPRYYFEERNY